MPFINLETLKQREQMPGFVGRFVHSENMTLVHWEIPPGTPLPEHSHPQEQLIIFVDGQFELTIDGETALLGPQSVAVIPSNAVHSGKALTKCRIIDVFSPVREDYR